MARLDLPTVAQLWEKVIHPFCRLRVRPHGKLGQSEPTACFPGKPPYNEVKGRPPIGYDPSRTGAVLSIGRSPISSCLQ